MNGLMIVWFPFIRFYILLWIILIIIFAFIVQIALGVWIYKDAKKRNMEAPLWLLVVLLTGLIGLIIYFIVREPKSPEKREHVISISTPNRLNEKEIATLDKGAKPTKTNVKYCSNCGEEIPLKALFCSNCGNKL